MLRLIVSVMLATALWSQNQPSPAPTAKDFAATLADEYGPRPTTSLNLLRAMNWVEKTMQTQGLKTQFSPYEFGRMWLTQRFAMWEIAPNQTPIQAVPIAWSGNTPGLITAPVAVIKLPPAPDPAKRVEIYRNFFAQMSPETVKGKIVLLNSPAQVTWTDDPVFKRLSDAELATMAAAPNCPTYQYNESSVPPTDIKLRNCFYSQAPLSYLNELTEKFRIQGLEIYYTLQRLGAVAVASSSRGTAGNMFPFFGYVLQAGEKVPPPMVLIESEQYGRLYRLVEKNMPVILQLESKSYISDDNVDSANLFADLPGSTKPAEMVMASCHLDSAPNGPGATDDAAGCGVLMELAQRWKTEGYKPKRAIRLAFWTGEEQTLRGSQAFVRSATPESLAQIKALFTLDNGSGKIRGIKVLPGDPAKDKLREWLKPLAALGAATISQQPAAGGSDYIPFRQHGVPAFEFVQDPLDYETSTWHSLFDSANHLFADDLAQAVEVMDRLLKKAADSEETLPRPPVVKQ